MYFDRMDICAAFYMFAALYHGGMGSKEYRIFSRLHHIRFNPSPSLSVEKLTENGRAIFDGLVSQKGFAPYS